MGQFKPKIAVIAPIYNYFPVIIGSMITQMYKNWELYLIHDGPSSTKGIMDQVVAAGDRRILYAETDKRHENFGHPIRRKWLLDAKWNVTAKDCDLVVITNADNYHNPGYLAAMSAPFVYDHIGVTYCSQMTHNYFGYLSREVELKYGGIDIGCVMVRKEIACEVGWEGDEHGSDWKFIDRVTKLAGEKGVAEVEGNLFVHN